MNSIIIVKVLFVLMALVHLFLSVSHKFSALDKSIVHWKERFEFIFVFLMSMLLLYLFAPPIHNVTEVSGETKLLLYLFGIVLLITAKWEAFVKESILFKRIQNILGVNE